MTLKFPDSNKSRGIGNLRLTLGNWEIVILAYTVLPVLRGNVILESGILTEFPMPLGAGIAIWNFGTSQKRVHRLPQPAFYIEATQAGGCWRRRPLATARLEAPSSSLDENPTTTIPGPLGKGMISGLCIARTGLKGKNGRVLNEVGLFLGQGRDDVARGDFLCMVKGVQVYGESLDDTHAMKISDTSFVVPIRRSDSHIWSSANEPEFGKVANAKFIAHYAGHEVRADLSTEVTLSYQQATGPAERTRRVRARGPQVRC